MNTYLLRLCSYRQPRRIRVIENVLTSHRTVANLFWAQQYGILEWLGARRQANQDQLDFELRELQAAGLVEVVADNQVKLTTTGVSFQEEQPPVYEPAFYSWYWLANTKVAFLRFLLGFQVVSEFSYHNRHYVPLNISFAEQQQVKSWFNHFGSDHLVGDVNAELQLLMNSLESEDERLPLALVNQLIGHGQTGWTLDQLCNHLQLNVADGITLTHDLALAICAFSRATNGPLACLIKPLLSATPLSPSNWRTFKMVSSGRTITEVARQRRLKVSTVREHLLTAAILMPQLLNWDQLLPIKVRQYIDQNYQGPVTEWQFASWSADSNADFFYFRLYQILQGSQTNE